MDSLLSSRTPACGVDGSALPSSRSAAAPAAQIATTVAAQPAYAQLPFACGTDVVTVGDSITHAGLYHSYVYLYHLTRFPERAVRFFNAGVGGDRAEGALQRYGWDVALHGGNVATLMLGMNDLSDEELYLAGEPETVLHQRQQERVNLYAAQMRKLVDRLLADGLQVILITPTIFDDTAELATPNNPGRNRVLGLCADQVRALAAEYGLGLVDFHAPMTALNLKLQAADPTFTLAGADRVHPEAQGHLAMAYWMLKALGATAEVASAAIDFASGKVTTASRCQISNCSRKGSVLRFDYLAGAIPFPVDQAARAALGWVPFAQELNRELLTVSGLPDGLYGLSIDGQLVRNFTAAELAAGVDLAAEDTPQMRQAQQLWELFSKELLAPVARLRTLAFVEHFAFPDGQHPLSLAQVEPKIDDWVASAEGKPYQGYLRESGVSYRTDKPLEQSLRDSALQAQPKLAAAAQPVRRRVVVAPASAQ